MDRSPARPQFHRCCRLCGCGFKRLGNTTGAGTRIAFGDWRAIRLGAFRFPNLGCLLYVGSDVGRVHRRPKTVAKWHLFAIHNSDLVNCSGNRFRSPLTHRGKGGRTQNDSSGELIGEKSQLHSLTGVVSVAPNYSCMAHAPAPCTKRKERGTQPNSHRLRFGPAALLVNTRFLQKRGPFFCQKH
jgi:hypothetical protein